MNAYPQSLGESAPARSIRMAQDCPRKASAKAHRSGQYYHVRNRTSFACVMDIQSRRDLHKLLGRWELA